MERLSSIVGHAYSVWQERAAHMSSGPIVPGDAPVPPIGSRASCAGAIHVVLQQATGYEAPIRPPADRERRPMMHSDFQVGGLDAAATQPATRLNNSAPCVTESYRSVTGVAAASSSHASRVVLQRQFSLNPT
ncbi:hypothetical protein GCM10018966_103680 [Streptomyces yanii]